MTLLALAAAWMAGLLIGQVFSLPPVALFWFLSACAFLALLLKARRTTVWPAVVAAIFLLALLRVQLGNTGAPPISSYNGAGSVTIEGVVAGDPEVRGRSVKLVVEGRLERQPEVNGKVLVWARPSAELVQQRDEPYFRYGDRLLLTGALETPEPFGDFDYGKYLARQGIRSVMSYPRAALLEDGYGSPVLRGVYALRHRLNESLAASLPGEQAALAQALLLGRRANVPEELTEAFRRTGTSHILAISGLHVGVLMVLCLGLGTWLLGRKRNLYLLLPLAAVWFYALLSGFSASVERAAIMVTVYLAALALGRQRSTLPALALAAAIMAGIDPSALQDISFQLSTTAVAGIALLTPFFSRLLRASLPQLVSGRPRELLLGTGLVEMVAVCTAATVATLPLIAFHFHRVSVVGIPATLLLLPAVPFALVIGALAAAGGLINEVVGQVLGWVAFVPLSYVNGLVGLLGRLPGVAISAANVSGLLVWLYYGVGVAALLTPRFSRRVRHLLRRLSESLTRREVGTIRTLTARRFTLVLPPVLLAGLAFLLWTAAATAPDGRLHVSFLDVGQGDSILIETPSGRQALVDGGPDPRRAVQLLGRSLPFWDRSLDLVVLTHAQDDHLAGLVGVVKRYDMGTVVEGREGPDTSLYLQWRKALTERGVPVMRVQSGQQVLLEEGLVLEVLGPPSRPFPGEQAVNENSVVLRLAWGEVSFLLTGDIAERAEYRLLALHAPVRSTLLKVAHHGAATSTSREFLTAVDPAVAVISVAAENRFGHPSPDVLSRLKARLGGGRIYSTAESGTVEFITDGARLWVKTAN